jgi:hypothetical protein
MSRKIDRSGIGLHLTPPAAGAGAGTPNAGRRADAGAPPAAVHLSPFSDAANDDSAVSGASMLLGSPAPASPAPVSPAPASASKALAASPASRLDESA